ncbi:LamB/YcsF family protein [Escherichia coli]
MKIDLNADLGEGCASDAELSTLVSSANIACGFHAGDAQTMQACVREAIKMVSRLALTEFSRQGKFGRSAMQLPPETVYAQTLYQIGALATIARAQGGVMRHVKPHARCTTRQRRSTTGRRHRQSGIRCDPALVLVGLAGSELIRAGKQMADNARGSVCRSRLSG